MEWSLWDNSTKRSFVVAGKAKKPFPVVKRGQMVQLQEAKATKSTDIQQGS